MNPKMMNPEAEGPNHQEVGSGEQKVDDNGDQDQPSLENRLLQYHDTMSKTVVIAVKCNDGLVLAADTLAITPSNGSRKVAKKIKPLNVDVGVVWLGASGDRIAQAVMEHVVMVQPVLKSSSNPYEVMSGFLVYYKNNQLPKDVLLQKGVDTEIIVAGPDRVFSFGLTDGVLDGDYSSTKATEVADDDQGIYVGGCGREAGTTRLLEILQPLELINKVSRTMAQVEDIVRIRIVTCC